MPSKLIWLVIILSILGIFDTAYLTAERYLNSPVYCPVGGNCDKVLSSSYAVIYGIPLAFFGLVFYLFVLILAMAYQLSGRGYLLKIFFVSALSALIFSGWLVYLQLFVINAICVYCVLSAINVTVLFIISIYFIKNFYCISRKKLIK